MITLADMDGGESFDESMLGSATGVDSRFDRASSAARRSFMRRSVVSFLRGLSGVGRGSGGW